jgi:hypothetical protein
MRKHLQMSQAAPAVGPGGFIYNLCVLPPVQFESTYYVIDNYEKI